MTALVGSCLPTESVFPPYTDRIPDLISEIGELSLSGASEGAQTDVRPTSEGSEPHSIPVQPPCTDRATAVFFEIR